MGQQYQQSLRFLQTNLNYRRFQTQDRGTVGAILVKSLSNLLLQFPFENTRSENVQRMYLGNLIYR